MLRPQGATPSRGPSFPRFSLAPMRGIDPVAIDTGSPVGRLILVLALAFNDLKGLLLFHRFLNGEARLLAGEPLSSRGQYTGLLLQTARFMAGLVHELMVELKEDQTEAIESPQFRGILAQLTSQALTSWEALLHVARGGSSPPGDSYSHTLLLVRNSLAFHYSAKALGRGYREHFADPSRPLAARAVFSDGKSMEDTRFFFADAAAEGALASVTGLSQQTVLNRVAELAATINLALAPIVTTYLRSIASTPYADVHVGPITGPMRPGS